MGGLHLLDELLLLLRCGAGGYHVEGGAVVAVNKHYLIGVPHVAQTLTDAAVGVFGVGGAHGEHAHEDKQAGHQQNGHAPFAEPLNTLADAAEDEVEVDDQYNQEEDEGTALPGEDVAVAGQSHEVDEELAVFLGRAQVQVTRGCVPGVAQGPGLEVQVVHSQCQRCQHTHDTQVLPGARARQSVEDGCRTVAAQAAATAAYTPLNPADGDTQQQECAEVCNHKCTAAVLGCQSGEAQEITEPDGTAGYCQHDAQVRVPGFGFCFR